MGMAASQARLLMLTGRLHDLEYEAQSIQNAKVQLATQQDQVYEEYQRALDATTLTFASINAEGIQSTVMANFTNLFSVNGAHTATGNNYVLLDSRGRVVVDDDVYTSYYEFINESSVYTQNAYGFAAYMTFGEQGLQQSQVNSPGSFMNTAMTVLQQYLTSDTTLCNLWNACFDGRRDASTGQVPGGRGGSGDGEVPNRAAQNQTVDAFSRIPYNQPTNPTPPAPTNPTPEFAPGATPEPHYPTSDIFKVFRDDSVDGADRQAFLNYFFQHYGSQIFNNHDFTDGDRSPEFNYYVRIFNAIQQHGGCISINEFNGPSGDAATNSEWLTAMVQSGQFTIAQFQEDEQGNIYTTGTSVSSDQNLSYTATTQLDRTALARAEAEYEHKMKVIDRKDKKFDLDLSKLETERNALTKQYDSVKKVIEDNIDRTFGIFS